jgi:hypothetical protein
MRQREGSTYRLLDGKRFVVSVGGAYVCDGAHRRPVLGIHPRWKNGTWWNLPLPHLRFYRCWRCRRVGGLVAYRLYSKLMRRVCVVPR